MNLKSIIRKIFTIPLFEHMAANIQRPKPFNSFWTKIIPPNSYYDKSTFRDTIIDGIRFKLFLNEWMEYILYFGIDADNKQHLYSHIKTGMNVIDVGTNFGETLLHFASLSKTGTVIGFEPVPYIFEKCKSNIALNNFDNIILENLALSDSAEELIFNDPQNNNSGGVFLSRGSGTNKVNAITLDNYIDSKMITKVDLIKIDVEGFEMQVIKGAINTLKKLRPLLIIELIDTNLSKQNTSSTEIIALLKTLGYNKVTDLKTGMVLPDNTSSLNMDAVFSV